MAANRLVGASGVASDLAPATNQTLGYAVPLAAGAGAVKSANQSFFQTQVPVSQKIFDVRRDFGAKGDGRTDDTIAIQQAIDAACAHGQDAFAYSTRSERRPSRSKTKSRLLSRR